MVAAENGAAGAVAGGVEHQGEHVDAIRAQAARGAPRVLDQLLRPGDVDVGGLAVGQHQQQVARGADAAKLGAGVTQRGAEPAGVARLQPGEARLHRGVVRFAEILDAGHADILTPVRGKGAQRKLLAAALQGVGEGGDGEALGIEHAAAVRSQGAGRGRDVEHDRGREAAAGNACGTVDAAVRRVADAQRDRGVDGGVEVELLAFGLSAQPDRAADRVRAHEAADGGA